MKTYEIFKDEHELQVAELIQQRRLQMLVHSCLYYELDTNLITDKTWGDWAKELAQLQVEYPNISAQVIWADAFKDWDGTTGAFLPLHDEWVMQKAHQLLLLVKSATTKAKPVVEQPKQPTKAKSKVKRLF